MKKIKKYIVIISAILVFSCTSNADIRIKIDNKKFTVNEIYKLDLKDFINQIKIKDSFKKSIINKGIDHLQYKKIVHLICNRLLKDKDSNIRELSALLLSDIIAYENKDNSIVKETIKLLNNNLMRITSYIFSNLDKEFSNTFINLLRFSIKKGINKKYIFKNLKKRKFLEIVFKNCNSLPLNSLIILSIKVSSYQFMANMIGKYIANIKDLNYKKSVIQEIIYNHPEKSIDFVIDQIFNKKLGYGLILYHVRFSKKVNRKLLARSIREYNTLKPDMKAYFLENIFYSMLKKAVKTKDYAIIPKLKGFAKPYLKQKGKMGIGAAILYSADTRDKSKALRWVNYQIKRKDLNEVEKKILEDAKYVVEKGK